ncbi:MAG: sce7726 family protein [Eubacterium sp.]|nr:sce7726 family protein [Eubacterium sp.]
MKDKQIRKILIEYLKASNSRIRIFQEKSIGSSICDVMTVTDCLTGYEIKSDSDNYQRFESQQNSYDRFFDKNYIVVGESHIKSAENKVPSHWGIVCIKSNNIEVIRTARKNQDVRRRSQLSVLWKLELKNLLIINSMPLFAQKDKGYISDRIAEIVDSDTLGKQIANELFNRDYSTYEAEDYTIKQDNPIVTNLPEAEIVDSLSEENLTEYTLDQWIALYHRAQIVREKKTFDYDKQLVKRTEHNIKYTDITPTLGAPWISEGIINEFIQYLYGEDEYRRTYRKPYARREPITGSWNVSEKKADSTSYNTNMTNTFGTNRFNALQILESTLNLREIKIHDATVFNQKETVAALEKQRVIVEEFNEWVWKSDDRIWEIEEAYNKLFDGFEKTSYDGSKLVFPEMNPNFELYDYQKDAVQKIITTNNTLLAFDVGAGKTYIMIAAAMKLREMGVSRKNMFVVPNNIVGQWEKIFTDLYPKAKVLTIEPKTFKLNMRTKALEQMRDGDYDGIIIAYSCFEMIPLSVDYVNQELTRKVRVIENAIGEMRSNWETWGSSALEREKTYIKKTVFDLIDSVNYEYQGITFDELEVNTLFLDEAHNYKNIPIRTALKNLNGINTKGSLKCLDMQKKIKCVQDNNGGRGAVLATGTPLCNSISDAYAMQLYLQPDEMKKRELDRFDNWVKTFAMPEQLCEIDVDTSKFRMVRRFVKFFNLPELSKMFSQVAIFHAVEPRDLPDFNGYNDIVIKKNPALSAYMLSLSERADLIRDKAVDKHTDNMLKVSTDGRKAALDLNLVRCEQAYDDYSKVYRCAKQVYEVYKSDKTCSQLIFCDYSTPKTDEFDVYNKVKELLMSFGVIENEIAFIHSYTTETRKLKLYEAVNNAKIKILIGSTFKLGIGANVQTKLKAIHHLDAPWRPADVGRILRTFKIKKNVEVTDNGKDNF